MNNLAIIPARGGSKRIPRKNIKDFLGKPIIAYSIEAAIESGLFEEVMVSTDDNEISEIAIKYGAKVPFLRSVENSNDFAGTLEVIKEVIDCYQKISRGFDYVCCIYPTAPFIKPEHLKEGFSLLVENTFSSVFPVVAFSYPILRSLRFEGKNFIRMNWPEYSRTRSQDLPKSYHDAGQWYWIDMTKNSNEIISDKSGAIILSESEVQDIDNISDWNIAELKYFNIINNK